MEEVISGDMVSVLGIIPSRWLFTLIKSRVVADISASNYESLSYPQNLVISVENYHITVEIVSRRIDYSKKEK